MNRERMMGIVAHVGSSNCVKRPTHSLFGLHNHEMCVERCISEGPQGIHHQGPCIQEQHYSKG